MHLTGVLHNVGGKKDFIQYMRDLDIGERSNIRNFTANMMISVDKILNQESEKRVEQVTREELYKAGFVEEKQNVEIIKYENQSKTKGFEKEKE